MFELNIEYLELWELWEQNECST